MNNPRLAQLTAEVARILNVDSIDPDLGLGELGIDSMIIVELLLACEHVYGIQVSPESLVIDQYTTLRDFDAQFSEACVAQTAEPVV